MATYNQIIERLKSGESLVKDCKTAKVKLIPSQIKVQYRTYRKLLFNNQVTTQHYSKYEQMEWLVINPNQPV